MLAGAAAAAAHHLHKGREREETRRTWKNSSFKKGVLCHTNVLNIRINSLIRSHSPSNSTVGLITLNLTNPSSKILSICIRLTLELAALVVTRKYSFEEGPSATHNKHLQVSREKGLPNRQYWRRHSRHGRRTSKDRAPVRGDGGGPQRSRRLAARAEGERRRASARARALEREAVLHGLRPLPLLRRG